jgi:UDP-N-acetylmuramate--alanine ligase
MDLNKIKKVHIIGIGGIGISAVAKLMIEKGKEVTGTDMVDSDLIKSLQEIGAKIEIGEHAADNLPKDTDLVVYTAAVPDDNLELVKARKLNIEILNYFQFLGQFSADKYTIAVTSTHGKTTTTALTGLIFDRAKFDPTVIVGSKITEWQGNLRKGKSKYFIVEACEYKAHMLEFNPKVIICNNIEFEHPDYFKDLNHTIEVFQEFINKLPSDGYFIYNADDPVLNNRIEKPNCNVLSYAIENEAADLIAKNIKTDHGRQIYKPVYKGQELKDFNLQIPGKFNILNALGPSLLALELGIEIDTIKDTLAQYTGAWRRFEIVGKLKDESEDKDGAVIISDYGHHPTEVAKTIAATKEFYPDKRLIVVFQPHQKKRTKQLFDDFVKTFNNSPADIVILSEIYDVAGREEDDKISSNDIKEAVELNKSKFYFAKDLDSTKSEILKQVQSDDVVLIMGAGTIDQVARDLI